MVAVNSVVIPVGEKTSLSGQARVVRVEPETDRVFLAFLKSGHFPKARRLSALEGEIAQGSVMTCEVKGVAAAVRPADPNAPLTRSQQICEDAWKVVEPLVSADSVDQLFDEESRAALLRQRVEESGVHLSTIYRLLARYFEGGMTKLALMPRYSSGTVLGEPQPDGQKRRGRKPTRPGAIRSEFVFTSALRKRMRKFLLEKYEGTLSFDDIISTLNHEFFSLAGSAADDSRNWLPESQRPTPAQYRWFLRKVDSRFAFTRAVDRHYWNLNLRPVRGKTRARAFGPGAEYQLDATGTQVYVVKVGDRSRVIGTATLYFVVDLYSAAIVGSHVTLQEESWDAARFALFNAFVPKGEIYRRAGLKDVRDEEIPFCGLPTRILGDRGELTGTQSKQIVDELLAVRLANARSYRGDDKAVIERLFSTIKKMFLRYLKGHTPKHGPSRGAKDPRKQAVLNMRELRELTYRFVQFWNERSVDREAIPEQAVLEHCEALTPLAIWKWGMANRTSRLRQADPDLLYRHLLPSEFGTIREDGIHFRRWVYQAQELNEAGWLSGARKKGARRIEVHFDESAPDRIWTWVEGKRRFVECVRRDPRKEYEGWSFADIEADNEKRLDKVDRAAQRERELKERLHQARLNVLAGAQREKVVHMKKASGAITTDRIRKNRRAEMATDKASVAELHNTPRRRPPVRLPLPDAQASKRDHDFFKALEAA